MIGSIGYNGYGSLIRSNSGRLNVFADSAEKDKKTAVSSSSEILDIVSISEKDVKTQKILRELADFQAALKSYRKTGDLEPLKEYYDKTGNTTLDPIFAAGKKTADTGKESASVFDNLKKTENYDISADKMENIAKRVEILYKTVNALFRFTDYKGIENYIKEATKLVGDASKMFAKAQAAIDKMPDGPEKAAAQQNLAALKSTLKRIIALAEKIIEKADILTAGMREKPESLKKFKKAVNDAKPLVADKPQTGGGGTSSTSSSAGTVIISDT